jgi:hypothetical protein
MNERVFTVKLSQIVVWLNEAIEKKDWELVKKIVALLEE